MVAKCTISGSIEGNDRPSPFFLASHAPLGVASWRGFSLRARPFRTGRGGRFWLLLVLLLLLLLLYGLLRRSNIG